MSVNESKNQNTNALFGKEKEESVEKYLGSIKDWHIEEANNIWIGIFDCNDRLKNLRLEYGFTQSEIASVLRITQREYWRIEQDGYKVPPVRLAYLAIFYNVSMDYIFGFIDEKRKLTEKPTSVNGYCLEDWLQAKAENCDYIPNVLNRIPEDLQEEIDEDNALFLESKKKAGLADRL